MGSKKHVLRNCVELDHEILEKNAVMELSLGLIPGGTGLQLWKKGKMERKKEERERQKERQRKRKEGGMREEGKEGRKKEGINK